MLEIPVTQINMTRDSAPDHTGELNPIPIAGPGVVIPDQVVNNQIGTAYTFTLDDAGALVTFDNAAAVTATIPPNVDVPFPIGAKIDIEQLGAGAVTFTAGAGVTISAFGGHVATAGPFARAGIQQIALDVWSPFGSLA